MSIQTNATDRRTLVQALSEHLHQEAIYTRTPDFLYRIGLLTVDRNSCIHSDDSEALESIKPFLTERGYIEPDTNEPDTYQLRIHVPLDGMNCIQIKNLIHMFYTQQYLLNKVTREETFLLSDDLISELADNVPETVSEFKTLLDDFIAAQKLRGIGIHEDMVYMEFPRSESAEKNKAYTELAWLAVDSALKAQRIRATRLEPENEKYFLRNWLVR